MILIQHKIKEENFDEHRTEDIDTLRQSTHYMLRESTQTENCLLSAVIKVIRL